MATTTNSSILTAAATLWLCLWQRELLEPYPGSSRPPIAGAQQMTQLRFSPGK